MTHGWTKSSHSAGNGACVEVKWAKSTRSLNEAHCLEVARGQRVAVRDSKDPDGPVLEFDRAAWQAFIEQVTR